MDGTNLRLTVLLHFLLTWIWYCSWRDDEFQTRLGDVIYLKLHKVYFVQFIQKFYTLFLFNPR